MEDNPDLSTLIKLESAVKQSSTKIVNWGVIKKGRPDERPQWSIILYDKKTIEHHDHDEYQQIIQLPGPKTTKTAVMIGKFRHKNVNPAGTVSKYWIAFAGTSFRVNTTDKLTWGNKLRIESMEIISGNFTEKFGYKGKIQHPLILSGDLNFRTVNTTSENEGPLIEQLDEYLKSDKNKNWIEIGNFCQFLPTCKREKGSLKAQLDWKNKGKELKIESVPICEK